MLAFQGEFIPWNNNFLLQCTLFHGIGSIAGVVVSLPNGIEEHHVEISIPQGEPEKLTASSSNRIPERKCLGKQVHLFEQNRFLYIK
jgi:hypothetical protein